jgi:hypothetical protein
MAMQCSSNQEWKQPLRSEWSAEKSNSWKEDLQDRKNRNVRMTGNSRKALLRVDEKEY